MEEYMFPLNHFIPSYLNFQTSKCHFHFLILKLINKEIKKNNLKTILSFYLFSPISFFPNGPLAKKYKLHKVLPRKKLVLCISL